MIFEPHHLSIASPSRKLEGIDSSHQEDPSPVAQEQDKLQRFMQRSEYPSIFLIHDPVYLIGICHSAGHLPSSSSPPQPS
jgi:hypothetical protein